MVDLPMSRQAVAKHLGILRDAGLIAVEARGRQTRYRLRDLGLQTVQAWLDEIADAWDQRLRMLKAAAEADSGPAGPGRSTLTG